MALKSKTVEINGNSYEVRELSLADGLPIMELLADKPQAFQKEMVKACVFKNGVSLGAIPDSEIGISEYIRLVPVAMELSGFGGNGQ